MADLLARNTLVWWRKSREIDIIVEALVEEYIRCGWCRFN